jgi:hypothetical protein
MINVQAPRITAERVAPSLKRMSPRAFWLVCLLEGAVLAALVLFAVSAVLPNRAPLVRGADALAVREAVWARVNGSAADPLIEIGDGVSAPESSLRGFRLNGQVYYYYFEGQHGVDPLSRGIVGQDAVDVLVRDQHGPQRLVIYQIRK